MPTSLPQAAMKLQRYEARDRDEPSPLTLFLSVFLSMIIPPVLLLLAASAIAGNRDVSLTSIGAIFEAAGRAELCLEARDCRDVEDRR